LKLDDDRVLTILTETDGVLTAFANHARRPRSALAPSTELLCYSHFELFRSRDRNVVDKADLIHGFFPLRTRVEDLALACYFAQLMGELAPKGEAAGNYINLMLACLHYLESGKRPALQLKAILELRLLTLAGYMPDLVECANCGAFESGMHFSREGQLFCADCAKTQPELIPLGDGVLAAMRHILYAEEKKLFAFTISEPGLKSLGNIVEGYLIHQLERTLPTLEYYRSINIGGISADLRAPDEKGDGI
jgi:DNA repair protein RecO (recombination protein O)